MASGDFLELSQRACYQARYNPAVTADLARAKEAINECYLSIINSGDRYQFLEKEGQFTITNATDKYSITSIASAIGVDLVTEIYGITNDTDGGRPLHGMDWLSLEQMSNTTQDGDPQGSPHAYALQGLEVRFYPWPDRTYTIGIFVLQGDAAMSVDADVPLIPLAWRHKILVPYAAMRLMEQHSGADALGHARYYRDQYMVDFQEFKAKYATARLPNIGLESATWNADLPGSVQSDWFSGDF